MIVSCGEALVDLVPHAVPGGGPMNVAVAAARLGAPTAFVGRISSDAHGDAIWRHLLANGVDLTAAERGDEPTARAIVEHVPELRFRFEGEGTADTCLRAADLNRLGSGPHIVHGGTLGLFRGRTAEVLADLVERHDGLVSLDPNVRPQIVGDRAEWEHYHSRWVARAVIYKASEEDLEWIWPGRDLADCAAQLLDGAAEVVLVTRGGDGATVFRADAVDSVPGRSIDVADTVGAGDTFIASALVDVWAALGRAEEPAPSLAGLDWVAIAEQATLTAAITCSRPGADPPTSAERSASGLGDGQESLE